jgi:hypothetical protein
LRSYESALAVLTTRRGFLCASLGRDSTVKVTVRLGRPFEVELLHPDLREGLGGDQGLDVAIQMAAIGQVHFQPVQPSLPRLHARFRAEAMLEEQELAARS